MTTELNTIIETAKARAAASRFWSGSAEGTVNGKLVRCSIIVAESRVSTDRKDNQRMTFKVDGKRVKTADLGAILG